MIRSRPEKVQLVGMTPALMNRSYVPSALMTSMPPPFTVVTYSRPSRPTAMPSATGFSPGSRAMSEMAPVRGSSRRTMPVYDSAHTTEPSASIAMPFGNVGGVSSASSRPVPSASSTNR